MKEQILQKLLEYIQNTEDFILEQTPEVIQQALTYEKIAAYMSIGLMLLLLSIAIFVGYYSWKHPLLDTYGSRNTGSTLRVFIPCIVSPLLFVQLCYSIDKLLKIYIAPKYFLIQLLAGLNNMP